ncbi:MAG: DUF502 domain-containing protein [Chitinivibrionales bacterium]|nr:DUF502 domain-containing protein [Chitinivibrionales bacterium]MBD3357032.1 DUF502 domain-containing protein [Chitinivibrionales bacterium]
MRGSLFSRLKIYFVAGIAAIFPASITIYVVVLLFNFLDNLVGRPVNNLLSRTVGFRIPGLGLLIVLFFVLLAGFLSRHWVGRRFFPTLDRFLGNAPLFTSIYPSAKQLSSFMFSQDKKARFKEVVLVEYPREGSYCMGFVTNEGVDKLDAGTGKRLVSVFIPFAPVPFSGLILLQSRERIMRIDVAIDDAIRFVVSGGIVMGVEKQDADKHGTPST